MNERGAVVNELPTILQGIKPMRNCSDLDKAYVAGIIDGEGYIGIGGDTISKITVTVANTDERLIKFLHELYDGSISTIQSKSLLNCRPGKMRKPVFMWNVLCNDAERLLNDVLPFLKIKDQHARVALKLREFVKSKPLPRYDKEDVSQAIIEKRLLFKAYLIKLNAKGILVPMT